MTAQKTIGAVLLALVLLAVACGSENATTNTADSGTAEVAEKGDASEPTTDTAIQEADDTDPDGELESSGSPIENLLGVPIFDDGAMETWFQDLGREAEIVVAKCMRGEGFEYTPVAIGGQGSTYEGPRDTLEYAEERGLGIVVRFNEDLADPANSTPDRNIEYVASLTDGERDAYQTALNGDVEPDGNPFAEGGCRGVATDEVFSIVAVFDEIEPVLDGYYDLYISDSRIIATTTQWQACMSEAGYLFAEEDEMYEHVFTQLDEVLRDETNFAQFDPEDVPDSNGPLGSSIRSPLVPAAQAVMDELGEEEKTIAIANWECREPIKETELAVQREYETEFVAEVGPQVRTLRGEG